MTPRTVHMQVRERIPNKAESDFRLCIRDGKLALDPRFSRVPTRDAILSAEDPNDQPAKNAISGICDPGTIWDGIEDALISLPRNVRDEVGKLFMSYALGQGWRVDASGTAITTGDSGRRLTNFEQRAASAADTIVEINRRNREHWESGAARTADSRAASTGAQVDDRRHVAADGAALAGATRDLVESINKGNAEFWAANAEASRAGR